MALGGVPPAREYRTTIYLSDPQLVHLGAAHFARNPLLRRWSDVADRNLVALGTADVFIDESLRRLKKEYGERGLSMCILGDVADTPCVSELTRFESLLALHGIPVDVYARGNHSSANAFGIINLMSSLYHFLGRVPFFKHFSLRDEVAMSAGHVDNVLTARGTFAGMHRILHQEEHHSEPGIESINVSVVEGTAGGYRCGDTLEPAQFDKKHRDHNFDLFWRSTKRTRLGDPNGTRFWECLVNADIADQNVGERPTSVTPFYIQASEQARFRLSDGSDVPVYNISLDGLDNTHFLAIRPGLSELQIKVIETFIDRMLEENPRARFKLSCHFSAPDLLRTPLLFWKGWRARRALKRLLAREEVILLACGHSHERAVIDLNKTLKLHRQNALIEVHVPSLIDYHPTSQKAPDEPPDARAVVIERLHVEETGPGEASLVIEMEYKGLDRREIVEGYSTDVHWAQQAYRLKHGYICAQETMKDLSRKHMIGWVHSHLKRLWEVVTIGLNPLHIRRAVTYWGRISPATYLIDNLTVASTVNTFNEAYHLLAFLESLAILIESEGEPGEMVVKTQIEGLRSVLHEEYTVRRHDFEQALSRGERPAELRQFNDLFRRAAIHTLPGILMQLRVGGKARAFALRTGIAASKEEFKYHGKKPSDVPKVLPPIFISI